MLGRGCSRPENGGICEEREAKGLLLGIGLIHLCHLHLTDSALPPQPLTCAPCRGSLDVRGCTVRTEPTKQALRAQAKMHLATLSNSKRSHGGATRGVVCAGPEPFETSAT